MPILTTSVALGSSLLASFFPQAPVPVTEESVCCTAMCKSANIFLLQWKPRAECNLKFWRVEGCEPFPVGNLYTGAVDPARCRESTEGIWSSSGYAIQ